VTICTAKIPTTTAKKLKDVDLMAMTRGIANKAYLARIDPKPIMRALGRDCPKAIGIDLPIRTKFIMLNKVPNKSPLPTAFSSRKKMQTKAITTADVKAQKQILFWTMAISSRGLSVSSFFVIIHLGGLHDLPIYGVAPSSYPQQNKNCDKEPFCVQPFIQVVPDSKTEQDRTCHGQAELHDQCHAIHPLSVLFKIKNFAHLDSAKNRGNHLGLFFIGANL